MSKKVDVFQRSSSFYVCIQHSLLLMMSFKGRFLAPMVSYLEAVGQLAYYRDLIGCAGWCPSGDL